MERLTCYDYSRAGKLLQQVANAITKGAMKENPLKDFKAGNNSEENYNTFDLHKPYADNIVLEKNGKKLFREPDLIERTVRERGQAQ